jgi:hypothetical protein
MSGDEHAVCLYLKGYPGQFVSAKEICRRASGKRRAQDEPRWAIPVLKALVEQKIVESDATGHYRLILKQPEKKPKRWVSPQVLRILQGSGKNFDTVFEIADPEDNLEPSKRKRPKPTEEEAPDQEE